MLSLAAIITYYIMLRHDVFFTYAAFDFHFVSSSPHINIVGGDTELRFSPLFATRQADGTNSQRVTNR